MHYLTYKHENGKILNLETSADLYVQIAVIIDAFTMYILWYVFNILLGILYRIIEKNVYFHRQVMCVAKTHR
jgi:hypothetical protein